MWNPAPEASREGICRVKGGEVPGGADVCGSHGAVLVELQLTSLRDRAGDCGETGTPSTSSLQLLSEAVCEVASGSWVHRRKNLTVLGFPFSLAQSQLSPNGMCFKNTNR